MRTTSGSVCGTKLSVADYDDVQDWLQELVSEDSGYVSHPKVVRRFANSV